jgi:hypothetical protein
MRSPQTLNLPLFFIERPLTLSFLLRLGPIVLQIDPRTRVFYIMTPLFFKTTYLEAIALCSKPLLYGLVYKMLLPLNPNL